MSVGVQNFFGSRLKEARLARGLFKNALGDMIGVTGTAITRYEDGLDKPHPDKFDALVNALAFPRQFFLTPPWPEEIGVVHWRSRTSESKSAREMTEQRMRWLCEIYAFLDSEVEFQSMDLPEVDLPADFNLITGNQIERAAEAIRKAWGFRLAPIPDVTLALENAGIPVAQMNISSEKQDGFCFSSPELDRTFVGINIENASAARTRLDVAHELGHIILHRRVTRAQANSPAAHKILEKQAFRFAGAFLFPREAFIEEAPIISLDYLCSLKRRWGMAISAMIVRASDLELIGPEEKAYLFRSLTRRRWRGAFREPYDSEMELEKPRMLRRAFEALLQSGYFSNSTILASLPYPTREIEQIAGLRSGLLATNPQEAPVRLRDRHRELIDLESGNVINFPRR